MRFRDRFPLVGAALQLADVDRVLAAMPKGSLLRKLQEAAQHAKRTGRCYDVRHAGATVRVGPAGHCWWVAS